MTETAERKKKPIHICLEILDENGNPMKITSDRVKVLIAYTKLTDEVFNVCFDHKETLVKFELTEY